MSISNTQQRTARQATAPRPIVIESDVEPANTRLSSEAALCSEIAARLIDLVGAKGGAWVHRYLLRVSAIAQRTSALELYCHAQSDDGFDRGLSVQAKSQGVSRQAIHDSMSNDIAFIGRFEPQLALELKSYMSARMQAVEHRRPTQRNVEQSTKDKAAW